MASLMHVLLQASARYARQQAAIENRQRREQERLWRAQIRAEEREKAKQDKAAFVELQKNIAIDMGEKLLDEFTEMYSTILQNTLSRKSIPVFEMMIITYTDNSEFTYWEPKPSFRNPVLEDVPQESWLEAIIKSKKEKRLQTIERNEHTMEQAKANYQSMLEEYAQRKSAAFKQWKIEKEKRKEDFIQNVHIEESEYLKGNTEVLKDYIEALIQFSSLPLDVIESHTIGYQPNTKQLVINFTLKDRDTIFYAGGYRYLIQKDEFVPTHMKVAEATARLRSLMVDLVISLNVIFFENDTAHFFDRIVINAFHGDICCISSLFDIDFYKNNDFASITTQQLLDSKNIRIFKTLKTGVKPFEFIYTE